MQRVCRNCGKPATHHAHQQDLGPVSFCHPCAEMMVNQGGRREARLAADEKWNAQIRAEREAERNEHEPMGPPATAHCYNPDGSVMV